MSTPRASSTSAEPHLLLTARLPCFTTGAPAPAATIAAAVLMLNVNAPSPPVPQVSTRVPSTRGEIVTACSSRTLQNAAISSGVSPLSLRAARKAPAWAAVAPPVARRPIACRAISGERALPPVNVLMASCIMHPPHRGSSP